LKDPDHQPDYRRRRDHAAFLTNLPLPVGELKGRLKAAWDARDSLPHWPRERVATLVEDRYGREEWTRRR